MLEGEAPTIEAAITLADESRDRRERRRAAMTASREAERDVDYRIARVPSAPGAPRVPSIDAAGR
jgi:hypothetical protein